MNKLYFESEEEAGEFFSEIGKEDANLWWISSMVIKAKKSGYIKPSSLEMAKENWSISSDYDTATSLRLATDYIKELESKIGYSAMTRKNLIIDKVKEAVQDFLYRHEDDDLSTEELNHAFESKLTTINEVTGVFNNELGRILKKGEGIENNNS